MAMAGDMKFISLATMPSWIIPAPPWPSGPMGRNVLTRTSVAGSYCQIECNRLYLVDC